MDNCIFCKIMKGEIPSKTIYEDDLVKVIMDVHPIVDGHALVIPKQHVADFTQLDSTLVTHIHDVARKIGNELVEKLHSKGLTLTVNYLDAQEIKHFHLHLLPDYQIKKHKLSVDEVYALLKNEK